MSDPARTEQAPTRLYAFFLISGISALLYQVIWAKQLSLLFGVTTYAISTTVSVFMLGLALGSWYMGRVADQTSSRLKCYFYLELGIGLSAALSLLLLEGIDKLILWCEFASVQSAGFVALRVLGTFAVLIVPSFLMGGTLPLLAREFVTQQADAARKLGRLYAFNTLGGVLGCLLSGFVLIPSLGIRGSLWVGVSLNMLIALLTYNLLKQREATPQPVQDQVDAAKDSEPQEPAPSSVPATGMLAAFCCAGLVGLAAEVAWTRLLLLNVDSTSYAFASMLAVYLIGLASGSALAGRWADRVDPVRGFGVTQMLIGMALAGSYLLWTQLGNGADSVRSIVNALPEALRGNGSFKLLQQLIQAVVLLLLPTFLMGCSFPFAARFFSRDHRKTGREIGLAYMLNTLGAMLGPLLCGFWWIQSWGLQYSLAACATLSMLAGLGLLLRALPSPQRWVCAAGTLALTTGLWLLPSDLTTRNIWSNKLGKILMYEEDLSGSVMVLAPKDSDARYQLMVGVTSMISDNFRCRRYTRLIGHLPALMHPKPQNGLVICLGSGMTLSAIAAHPEFEHIDCVDLSTGVMHAARTYFKDVNFNVLADPRVNLIVNDGRTHLLATSRRYDVIALEPPPPNNAGVANLYSQEFYKLCRSRMTPDGMVVQWIPYYSVTYPQIRSLIASMQSVFPTTTMWDIFDGEYCIIGHASDAKIPYARLAEGLAKPRVKEQLDAVGVRNPEELLSCFVFGPEGARKFSEGALPVTDDFPNLGYDFQAFASVDPGSPLFWRQVQEANLATASHAEEAGEWLAFSDAGERTAFEKRFVKAKGAFRMQSLAMALTALPAAEYPVFFGKAKLIAPVLLEPGNAYYQYSLKSGIYEEALKNLTQFWMATDPQVAESYLRQARTLGLLPPAGTTP